MDPRFPDRHDAVLPDILERRAREHPDKTFALFPDGTWTYQQTADRAWSTGNGLRRLGVEPGDYVLSWLPTGANAIQTWFGINAAGAVYTPLNTSYRGTILERAINLTGASVMVVHAALVDRLAGLPLPRLETIVVVGEPAAPLVALEGVRTIAWDAVVKSDP